MSKYKYGEPCGHPGCLHHATHPCEGCGRIAGKFDYATLLARHNALVEAVAWERECEAVRNELRPFRNWPELAEAVGSYQAARAEVDRLLEVKRANTRKVFAETVLLSCATGER